MTMDIKPYPLKFEPIFKERIWGGQRLQSHFGKDLPNGPVGECWELADLPQDQSVIANGPWAGRTLADILDEAPEAITGNPNFKGPFPLLIKLLDAQDLLSVQATRTRAPVTAPDMAILKPNAGTLSPPIPVPLSTKASSQEPPKRHLLPPVRPVLSKTISTRSRFNRANAIISPQARSMLLVQDYSLPKSNSLRIPPIAYLIIIA